MRARILSKIAPRMHVRMPLPKPHIAPPDPTEPHYTVAELSQMWRVDAKTLREWFKNTPGVLRTGNVRLTLSVPRSVMERVHRERTGE